MDKFYDTNAPGMRINDSIVWGYALKLGHVYNLITHWMLYKRGKAAYPPVLDMPPQAVLDLPQFAGGDVHAIYALWFGFATVKQHAPREIGTNHLFAQIAAPAAN
jgi:hypothetical protein